MVVAQVELFPTGALGIADPAGLGAYGAMVVTALFTLLYVYRRRVYILQWVLAWVLITGALSLSARDTESATVALLMLGLSRFLSLTAILALASSALTFRTRRWLNRRYLLGLVPILGWCVASPFLFDPRLALLPGYVLSAALLVAGGLAFLAVLRQAQLLGTGVIAVALLLTAATQVWIGLTVARSPTGVLPAELMVVNGLLFLFAALGMHLLVFEEMIYELRVTNHRLQETQTELHELAITDTLTGCHNRRFFYEVIGRELQRHQRYDLPVALLFMDIDQFKMVNDTCGHAAGDRLLEFVARFLTHNVREADYVFRWGGDEFLVLLSCTLEEAQEKAGELTTAFLANLETSTSMSDLPTGVGLSVGCSEVVAHTDDIMARIREADEAMYRNKEAVHRTQPGRSPV